MRQAVERADVRPSRIVVVAAAVVVVVVAVVVAAVVVVVAVEFTLLNTIIRSLYPVPPSVSTSPYYPNT